jgi:TP901 family phage tail tape measure protein
MSLKIDRVQLEIIVQQDSARQKMIELEEKIKNTSSTLNKLKKQFGENSEEYKKQAKELRNLKQQYDDLFTEIGIGKLSLKELGNRQRELNAILRNLDPSLPQWKQYNQQLKEVNARIRELRNEAKETQFSIAKLADGFNRYAAIGASVIASLTGVALTARKCVDEYAQMEEAQSQVIKYTGMTKEETEALNESFKQMDTRTPREELNRLAGEAGKLGISSRDQVLEFVEAADMINVALGEDLGEDAVKNIGKLSQMFGDGTRTLKEDMLAIGSAVNQVAQSSSASEPYLVEFTARMGGVAKQADLAVTDVMGFASALDQNMLRSEMASTALQGLILKIYQEPAKYAKLAGMDVQEFVNLVNTDVNEALLQFLGTLGKMGGMAQMSPILKEMKLSGAEAAGVISALAGNIDQVRREQENANQAFIDGTSIINEFGVQNNTVQAGLDKAKKQFKDVRVELGEQLLPVMKYMVTTGSLTVKGLKQVVSIMVDYKSEILTVGAAVVTYTLYLKAATLWTNRHTVATKTATVATTLFNKALKMSPWGLALAGVASLISYFAIFKDKTDEATASLGSMNDELDKTKETMDLISKVKLSADNFQFLTDRQKQQMKADAQKGIEELDDLITQGMITNKQWYESEKQSLLKLAGDNEILRKLYMSGLEHDLRERMSVIAGYIEEKKELQKIIGMVPDSNNPTNVTVPTDQKDAEAALKSRYQNELNLLKEKYLNQQLTEEQYNKALYDAEVKYLASRKLLLEQYGQDSSEIQGQIYDKMIAEANRLYEETKTVDKNWQSDMLASLEADYQKQVSDTKQAYLDGDIKKEADYQERLKELEADYLQQRKEMLEAYGEDVSAINEQIQNNELKDKKDAKANRKEELEKQFANTDSYEEQLDILQQMYDEDIKSYEQYQEAKDRLSEQHEQKRKELAVQALDYVSQAASSASQLIQALQDAEISRVEKNYDKQIDAAKKAGKDTTKLEKEKEAATQEIRKKYADKEFAAKILEIVASTAVAIMQAWKMGPVVGAIMTPIITAQGAAQMASAEQARSEARGLKSGGYSDEYVDGYTRKGNPDDVAGVIPVHKNEFVANHEAVANPAVKQFLDVFDVAQKKGTIRMLNTTQILEQVRTRSGRYSGGYTYDNPTRPSATFSAELGQMTPEQRLQVIALLQENNRLLAVLCNKELVVDPRKVRDGIKRVETLERNVSR